MAAARPAPRSTLSSNRLIRHTNLQRRFGLGDVRYCGPKLAASGLAYLAELEAPQFGRAEAGLDQDLLCDRAGGPPAAGSARFRLFQQRSAGRRRYRAHPLQQSRQRRRNWPAQPRQDAPPAGKRAEDQRSPLSARRGPAARTVQGGSWLYNLEAYRRLFPVASRRPVVRPPPGRVRLGGTSSWGQFLDYREAVKPDLRAAFLRNIETLDVDAPWRAWSTAAPGDDGMPIDLSATTSTGSRRWPWPWSPCAPCRRRPRPSA